MMEVTVSMKHAYGKVRIVPYCHRSHLFANIAGTQTLTRKALHHIHTLGYEVRIHDHALGVTHRIPFDKLVELNIE
jgi:hypothetical protein